MDHSSSCVFTAVSFTLLVALGLPGHAVAQSPGNEVFALDTPQNATQQCNRGFEWRLARPEDRMCVTWQSHQAVVRENREASSHWVPTGSFGPYTCELGLVWREAYVGDVVCVTPARKQEVQAENVREMLSRGQLPANDRQQAGETAVSRELLIMGSGFSLAQQAREGQVVKPYGAGIVVTAGAGAALSLTADIPVAAGSGVLSVDNLTIHFMTTANGPSLEKISVIQAGATVFEQAPDVRGSHVSGNSPGSNSWQLDAVPLNPGVGSRIRLDIRFPPEPDVSGGYGSFFIKDVSLRLVGDLP